MVKITKYQDIITKEITKNQGTITKYYYDALGRRIGKYEDVMKKGMD